MGLPICYHLAMLGDGKLKIDGKFLFSITTTYYCTYYQVYSSIFSYLITDPDHRNDAQPDLFEVVCLR
jgi:hypothetical protein